MTADELYRAIRALVLKADAGAPVPGDGVTADELAAMVDYGAALEKLMDAADILRRSRSNGG